MEWIAIVTALILIEYMWIAMRVGTARGKYGVAAPATTGNEIFERHYRVQQNTVEQLVIFLPALWIFGNFASAPIGAAVGVLFLVGRAVYAVSYVADPSSRSAGFMMTFAANVILVLGALGAAVKSLL